ncbi:MAG: transcriptional regulator, family [Polaromonas sp.]|nr:transcriptional regulator, family [Polaromonas sp.]
MSVTGNLFSSDFLDEAPSKKMTGPKKKGDVEVVDEMAMGTRLRERRLALKLSFGEVAAALHISGQRYRNWEERFGLIAQSRYLESLAAVLGTSPGWLRTGQHSSSDEEEKANGVEAGSSAAPAALKILRLGKFDRQYMGKRAKKRRDHLKLKGAEVALILGIDADKLGIWERCLAAFPDSRIEAKWEQVLQVPPGWLRETSITASAIDHASTEAFVLDADRASVAGEIRAIGCWLVRESVAKRTSHYHLLNETERRGADMFALRYGVEGEQASTLQVIGERYGITRERTRQITAKLENRKGNFTAKTPCLDRLHREIQKILPVSVEQIDADFRDLLGEELSVENAERFAREVLGQSIVSLTEKFSNPALGYSVFAVDPASYDPHVIRACRDVAQSLIRITGAAQVSFVAGQASTVVNRGVSAQECTLACKLMTGFEWLAEDDGRFWFGPKWENRLLTVTRKVLAVANRKMDIEDIQGAMTRSRRNHYERAKQQRPFAIDAPYWVLVEVLKRVTWLKVIQHDDFELVSPVAIESVLSEVELAVTRLAHAHGGVIARYTLVKELLQPDSSAFSAVALHMTLDSSPIFYRLDAGIFALRGAALHPDALAKASQAVGGENQYMRSQNLSVNGEGALSIKFELKSYVVNSRYFEMPSILADRIPQGDYKIDGFEEKANYQILPSGSCRLRRVASKLIKMGFVVGDFIQLDVNPLTRVMNFSKAAVDVCDTVF